MAANAVLPSLAPGVESTSEFLLREVLRAQATTLARAGRLPAAARLLESAPGSADAADLHLLARIRAQAGEWVEAERLWLQLLALQPSHAGAQAALTRLRATRQGARHWLLWLSAAALAALVVFGLLSQRPPPGDTLAALQKQMQQDGQARELRASAESQKLDAGLQALAAAQQAMEARLLGATQEALGEPWLGFAVAGLMQQAQGQTLWLWFEADPLGTASLPTRAGGARLQALARSIAQSQQRVRLEVMALAGPGVVAAPVIDAGDAAHALQRAHNAAQALHAPGVLPPRAVVVLAVPVASDAAWSGPAAALRAGGALVFRLSRLNHATGKVTN